MVTSFRNRLKHLGFFTMHDIFIISELFENCYFIVLHDSGSTPIIYMAGSVQLLGSHETFSLA